MIGLLGGSFNPAHDGHRHISEAALKSLRIDQLWWLVSPQNPLKATDEMAPQRQRIRWAEQISRHPRIRVSGMEAAWGTRFTADSLVQARRRYPNCRFIWIMGADNLRQICHWDRWQRIFRMVAVAVFDRSPYSHTALAGLAARRFARGRLTNAGRLAKMTPPAWIFMHIKRHPASATAIRRQSRLSAAR